MKYSQLFFLSLITLFSCENRPIIYDNDLLLLDMVHDNPGESPFLSSFKYPKFIEKWGYDAQVVNDFKFIQTAITFETLDPRLISVGSKAHGWILERAKKVDEYIRRCQEAGIQCLMFTDVFILPNAVVEAYGDEILDENGRISLARPKTREIHQLMFREIFERFPGLDGLVIRTGETYLNNLVFHTGNGPFYDGMSRSAMINTHIELIRLLRDEVCVNANKKLLYRTWAFGGIHTEPEIYLHVTNEVEPHENLYFSIKHTKGDFHRNFPFNPTINIGRHQQIIEVQCQREYEGKGAHPNYIAESVINGFEEYANTTGIKSLSDLKGERLFKGIWTWSRGGGWKGPYIKNELWPKVNAYVFSQWARDTTATPSKYLEQFAEEELKLSKDDAKKFQEICGLSAKGVVRGRSSLIAAVNPWWIRDEFMGGIIADSPSVPNSEDWGKLNETFDGIIASGLVEEVLSEKEEAAGIWYKIERLSNEIEIKDKETNDFLKVSGSYGRIKYSIINHAWRIMLYGYIGDTSGNYNKTEITTSLKYYDALWKEWDTLKRKNPLCPTLYKPFGFVYKAPDYHGDVGLMDTVDRYKNIIQNQHPRNTTN